MALNQTLAYLAARGAQLPPGEGDRLQHITIDGGDSDRFVVSFNDSADQQCIWTLPRMPETYQGGNLVFEFEYQCTDSDAQQLALSVEVERPDGTFDPLTNSQWDTANTATPATAPTGNWSAIAITLISIANAGASYPLRFRFTRTATSD